MFDSRLRRASDPILTLLVAPMARRGVAPATITVAALTTGLAAAGAAAAGRWWIALALWLTSRLLDGFDGALARVDGPTPRGGFIDLVADFAVYGAFVVGVAIQLPDARLAAVVLLCTYYVSGVAFLAWSAAASADARLAHDDERSIRFVGGLAEGFETVVAYTVICLIPSHAATVMWIVAAMVAITAVQRVVFAVRDLPG